MVCTVEILSIVLSPSNCLECNVQFNTFQKIAMIMDHHCRHTVWLNMEPFSHGYLHTGLWQHQAKGKPKHPIASNSAYTFNQHGIPHFYRNHNIGCESARFPMWCPSFISKRKTMTMIVNCDIFSITFVRTKPKMRQNLNTKKSCIRALGAKHFSFADHEIAKLMPYLAFSIGSVVEFFLSS